MIALSGSGSQQLLSKRPIGHPLLNRHPKFRSRDYRNLLQSSREFFEANRQFAYAYAGGVIGANHKPPPNETLGENPDKTYGDTDMPHRKRRS